MLEYALKICKDKGKKEVIIGCYKDNLSSATVIKNNNGVLIAENDNYKKGILANIIQLSYR